MAKIQIKAQPRTEQRKLRSMLKNGLTPAVIYDQKGTSQSIKIASNEVQKMLEHITGTPLVEISIEGGDTYTALIREVQNDLRANTPSHISFFALDPGKPAAFDVEIVTVGESPAVRNSLGVLIMNRNSVELRGLPKDIPTQLEANITNLLQVGDSISVSDLHIPEGLEFVHEHEKEYSVASIQPFQKTYEEEKQEEEAAAVAAAEAAGETLPEEGAEGTAGEAGEEAKPGEESAEETPASKE
jgi:large subunit ribosomal protein L25